MGLLDAFRKRAPQDFEINLPDTTIVVNHALRVVFIYSLDSDLRDDAYDSLEAHLKKRGYYLKIIVAARGMALPPGE